MLESIILSVFAQMRTSPENARFVAPQSLFDNWRILNIYKIIS